MGLLQPCVYLHIIAQLKKTRDNKKDNNNNNNKTQIFLDIYMYIRGSIDTYQNQIVTEARWIGTSVLQIFSFSLGTTGGLNDSGGQGRAVKLMMHITKEFKMPQSETPINHTLSIAT